MWEVTGLYCRGKCCVLGFIRQHPANPSKGNTRRSQPMKQRDPLCRALQSAKHQLATQWEWRWSAKIVEDERCEARSLVVVCRGGPCCIRFTSSPWLASPCWLTVLLCISFFMSAANLSYCWPKVLSQSRGNFCCFTLIILSWRCAEVKGAFTGFRLKVYFERINGMILGCLKYHSAMLQSAHPWLSLEPSSH